MRTYRPYSDGLPLMLAHLNLGLFVPSNVVQRSKESYAAIAYASNPSSIALPAASVARFDTALVDIM